MNARSGLIATFGFAVLLVAASTVSLVRAQQAGGCLHDSTELDANRMRRIAALTLTRAINTAEARIYAQGGGRYQPFEGLAVSTPVPAGFDLQLVTDGGRYQFAVKDTFDPCRFAFLSDQEGVILRAQVIQ